MFEILDGWHFQLLFLLHSFNSRPVNLQQNQELTILQTLRIFHFLSPTLKSSTSSFLQPIRFLRICLFTVSTSWSLHANRNVNNPIRPAIHGKGRRVHPNHSGADFCCLPHSKGSWLLLGHWWGRHSGQPQGFIVWWGVEWVCSAGIRLVVSKNIFITVRISTQNQCWQSGWLCIYEERQRHLCPGRTNSRWTLKNKSSRHWIHLRFQHVPAKRHLHPNGLNQRTSRYECRAVGHLSRC